MTTRLFPDLKFGCFGTIVKVTAAVVGYGRFQDPKVQIWRENETQPGLYRKIAPDIPLNRSDLQSAPCYQNTYNSGGFFQCVLNEDHRISVQPGDFLGHLSMMMILKYISKLEDQLTLFFKVS